MSLDTFSDLPFVVAVVLTVLLFMGGVVTAALLHARPVKTADHSADGGQFWGAAGEAQPVLVFAADIPAEAWLAAQGGVANVDVSGGGLHVRHSEGALSARSAPAEAGRVYVCEFEVKPMPAEVGGPLNFYAGPVMTDADGQLVRYWIEQPAFSPGETVRRGYVEIEAPPEAASVHVGVHGSWLPDGRHGQGGVEFSLLRLYVR